MSASTKPSFPRTENARAGFPGTHDLPVNQSPYDDWYDLKNGCVSIMIGAIAAVGAMVVGTLF